MSQNVGIFLGTGYEEIEALTVVDLLRRAGIPIAMISITEDKKVTGSHGIEVTMDQTISEVDFDQLDCIVLPGGMPGTKNLEACSLLMEQVDAFYNKGKYIAAICAAPSILGHRGILASKDACCYPGFESHLTDAKVNWNEVSVSDHVITSRGMGTAIPFALKLIELFIGLEKAEELAKGIIYRA